jgi:Protein of unknown function (DUF1698)
MHTERSGLESTFIRFELRAPSEQTAVDVFHDKWACDLGKLLNVTGTGSSPLFTEDVRPVQVAQHFGRNGSLAGMRVLELGPLEAAHTWKLEQLGAESITAVESNVEAWLKCLIVKEVLHLRRSRFLLGDAIAYMKSTTERFDLIMCSGVLYHMTDPLALIEQIAMTADRCFVWTHYYDPERRAYNFVPSNVARNGQDFTYWTHTYSDRTAGFWGGNSTSATWMTETDLLRAFHLYGLNTIKILGRDIHHSIAPVFSFVAES